MTITKKLTLHFPKEATDKPIVYHLVKDYDLVVNIFRAKVTPEEVGYLVLEASGTEKAIRAGIEFARAQGVEVGESVVGLSWDEGLCTHCGNCLAHCPSGSLHIADDESRRIAFDPDTCIECLACISNCPFGACSSVF